MAAKTRGRKAAHFVDSEGTQIKGLARRPSDGRWRIIETGLTFTEPDERRAIEKFRKLTNGGPSRETKLRIVGYDASDPDDWALYGPTDGLIARMAAAQTKGESEYRAAMRWFAGQIHERRKYVAEATGIEQIGYLAGVKAPERLPTLKEVQTEWDTHARCAVEQRRKVARAWEDFVAVTKVRGLEDITASVAVQFKDAVDARPISDKQRGHIYSGIRRILRFTRQRAKAIPEVTRILNELAVLVVEKSSVAINPMPIAQDEWVKLYDASEGDDRALILLMLNGALYIKEASRLIWDDIADGCLVTNREKTGKCVRIAPLWPETIAALAQVKRAGHDRIFVNYRKEPLHVSGAQRRFDKLREAAGLPHLVASQLRDGAATATLEANVNTDLCALLLGHRSGVKDFYALRKPLMVKPATDAIYAHYIAPATGGKC